MIWRCLLRLALVAVVIAFRPVTLSRDFFSWSSEAAQNYSDYQQNSYINSSHHMTNNISKLLQDVESYPRIDNHKNYFEKEHRFSKNGSRQHNVTDSEEWNKFQPYYSIFITTGVSKHKQNLIYYPNKNLRRTIKFINIHSATPKLYRVNNSYHKNIVAYKPFSSQTIKKNYFQDWSSDKENLKKSDNRDRGLLLIKKPLQKKINFNLTDGNKHESSVNETLTMDQAGNISRSAIGFENKQNLTKLNSILSAPISLTSFNNDSNNDVRGSPEINVVINEFMKRFPYYANFSSMPMYPRIIDFGYLFNSSLTLRPFDDWPQTVINAPIYMNVFYNTKPANIVGILPPECFTTTPSTLITDKCLMTDRNCTEEKAFFRRVHHHPEDDEFLSNNTLKPTKYQTGETDTPGTRMDVLPRGNSSFDLAAFLVKAKSARPKSNVVTTTEYTVITQQDDESSKEAEGSYTECQTIYPASITDDCIMTEEESPSTYSEVEKRKLTNKSNQNKSEKPESSETVVDIGTSSVTSTLPVNRNIPSTPVRPIPVYVIAIPKLPLNNYLASTINASINSTEDYLINSSYTVATSAQMDSETSKFEKINSTSEEYQYTDFNDYPFDLLLNSQVNKVLNLTQFNEGIENLLLNPDTVENNLLKSNLNESLSDKCLANVSIIQNGTEIAISNHALLKANEPVHILNNTNLLKNQIINNYKSGWDLNKNGSVLPITNYNETAKEINNKKTISKVQNYSITGNNNKYENLRRLIFFNTTNVSMTTGHNVLNTIKSLVGLNIRKNIANALKENKNELLSCDNKGIYILSDKYERNPFIKNGVNGIQDKNNSMLFQRDKFNEEKEIFNKNLTDKLFTDSSPGIKPMQLKQIFNYISITQNPSNENLHTPKENNYFFKLCNTPSFGSQNNVVNKSYPIESISNLEKIIDMQNNLSCINKIITSTESYYENNKSDNYKNKNNHYETLKLFAESDVKNYYEATRDNENITTAKFLKSYNPVMKLLLQEITAASNNFSVERNKLNFITEPILNSARKEILSANFKFTQNTESNSLIYHTSLQMDNASRKISWPKLDSPLKPIETKDIRYSKITYIPDKFKPDKLNFNKEIGKKFISEHTYLNDPNFQTNKFLNDILTNVPTIHPVIYNDPMKDNGDNLNKTVTDRMDQINVYGNKNIVNSSENVTRSNQNKLFSKIIDKLFDLSTKNVYLEKDLTRFYYGSDKLCPTTSNEFVSNLLNEIVKNIVKNKSVLFEYTRLPNNNVTKVLNIELPVKSEEETRALINNTYQQITTNKNFYNLSKGDLRSL